MRLIVGFLSPFLFYQPTIAWAGSASGTVNVSANVAAVCQSLTATDLAFGVYDPTSSTKLTSATFSIQCTAATPIVAALSAGTTSGASMTGRKMTDGAGNTLNYQLFTDASQLTIWGDGTGGSKTVTNSGTGLSAPVTFTVYGAIPSGQYNVVPGQYTDRITITVSY